MWCFAHECPCALVRVFPLGVGFPRTGVTYGCEAPCRCWESNPDPRGEKLELLINHKWILNTNNNKHFLLTPFLSPVVPT